MSSLPKIVAWGSLLSAVLIAALIALVLTSGGGGPYVGAAIGFMVVLLGCVGAFLVAVGLIASIILWTRGDRRPVWGFGAFLGALLVIASAITLSRNVQREQYARATQESDDRSRASLRILTSDPAELANYVASYGVNIALPGTWKSPLDITVETGNIELARQFLAQGAGISADAFATAAKRGDAPMVTLLLAHPLRTDASAYYGLKQAFLQGREDIARLFLDAGVPVGRLVEESIRGKLYPRFCPGDVYWRAVRENWSHGTPPAAIREAVYRETRESKTSPSDFNEDQVLEVLNRVLNSEQRAGDATNTGEASEIQVKLPTARWNWLREVHAADAIVPAAAGKGFTVFRLLTMAVADKLGDEGQRIVAAAVASGDVDLAETLVRQGYDLSSVENNEAVRSLPRTPYFRPMNDYLQRHGIRVPGADQ